MLDDSSGHRLGVAVEHAAVVGVEQGVFHTGIAGFLVAGEILAKVSGLSWEEYVQQNILTPLSMKNTYMNTAGLASRTNVAYPHNNLYSSITKIPFDNVDNLGPATSMVSNVRDLTKWLLFQLDSGRYEAKQVLPWAVLQKTRDINIITAAVNQLFTRFISVAMDLALIQQIMLAGRYIGIPVGPLAT